MLSASKVSFSRWGAIQIYLPLPLKRSSASVCDFVCLFVRTITQKTNDPKVYKLGTGNDHGIAFR